MTRSGSQGRLVPPTSSVIPIVKRDRGPLLPELVEDRADHARGQLLGGQPVAAADDLRHRLDLSALVGLRERGEDVEEERLAVGAGLLGPVEHGDPPHAGGERGDELGSRERPVEAHLEGARPRAPADEVGHGLAHRLCARPHADDDDLGGVVAGILDEPVGAGPCARPARP